jgi:phage FluMu gp28-like protein
LQLIPYEYQVKFLKDMHSRIIVCAGRQVGKSLITAARAVWFAFARPGSVTLIVSPSLGQSILMFDKVLDYVLDSEMRKSVTWKTRTLIRFSNKSIIRALPCGPHGKMIRGNAADLIIVDEAAFVPEKIIKEVAMPMLAAKNGSMILISSPWDKKHFFYQMFNSPRWSRYHFKTEDNPSVSKQFLEETREDVGESSFRREYLAEFVEDEDTFFAMSQLRSAVHVCGDKTLTCSYCEMINGVKIPEGDLYAGYDPGGLVDPAALVVVQRQVVSENDKKRVVFRVVYSKTFLLSREQKTARQDQYTRFTLEVSDIHQKMHFTKLCMDKTGLGAPILEHCKELKLPVEGLTFSPGEKSEMFSELKIMLEQNKIEYPENLELLSHLNSVVAKRNRMGSYTFDHASGTHDDLAVALALALRGARTKSITTVINKF